MTVPAAPPPQLVFRPVVGAPPLPRYRLIVDIFEGDTLVITHVFYGHTEQQAHHFYSAHMQSDAYLRGCVTRGLYAGNVACRAVMRWDVG